MLSSTMVGPRVVSCQFNLFTLVIVDHGPLSVHLSIFAQWFCSKKKLKYVFVHVPVVTYIRVGAVDFI